MCFMPSDSCPSSLETQLCRWSLQQQFPGRFWRLHAKRFARQPGCGEHHWVRISAFLGVKLMASASSNPGLELTQKNIETVGFPLLCWEFSWVLWVDFWGWNWGPAGICRRFRPVDTEADRQLKCHSSCSRWEADFKSKFRIWMNLGGILSGLLQSIVGKKMPQDRDMGWPWFYDSMFSRFSPFPPLSLRGERFSVQLPSSVCSTRCSSPGGLSNTVGHPRALESHGFPVDLSHGWFMVGSHGKKNTCLWYIL